MTTHPLILRIIRMVSRQYCDHPDEIYQNTRRRHIVIARQICMYLANKYTLLSATEIGREIGGKTHSTVIHACRTVKNRMQTERDFRYEITRMEETIQSRYREMYKAKVYISGKISGLPLPQVKQKFAHAAAQIKKAGYVAVNPVDNGLSEHAAWSDHMRADIKLMLDCDIVYLLPDWTHSKGAVIEKKLAEALGIKCVATINEL